MNVRRVHAGPAGGFDVHRVAGEEPGRRVVVLGGVHGDETEGALAAGRLAFQPPSISRGVLEIVPVCHEAAFAADSRVSPIDGENLARVFPGDGGGTPTSRLAHHIYAEVLEGADLLIDLHTSGRNYDMPFLAGFRGESRDAGTLGERAARAFGADFVWRHQGRSVGRTTSVVDQSIYCEAPGSGRTDHGTVDAYVTGVERVLDELEMIVGPPRRSTPQVRVTGGGDLDRDMISVSRGGVFLSFVGRGERIESGRLLGSVIDVAGRTLEDLFAPSAGYVMALKGRSPVRPGDLVICLAAADGSSEPS
ncbi:MAG: M14 family metallopeptidase [Acidimicrobiia bacterium]|nr:M14 family metallopeptidase [Acidimicrobiia bacterium]